MIKSKSCIIDGCEQSRWAKGYCKRHQGNRTDKKPKELSPRKAIKKISEKGKVKKELKKVYVKKQFELFQKFYDEHPTKTCFECGSRISQAMSYNIHHCLPKSRYKDIALDSQYWILVCLEDHSKAETNIDTVPKIKQHTINLLARYVINKNRS